MKLAWTLFFVLSVEYALSGAVGEDPKFEEALSIMDSALRMKDHGLSLDWDGFLYSPLFNVTGDDLDAADEEALERDLLMLTEAEDRIDTLLLYYPEIGDNIQILASDYTNNPQNRFKVLPKDLDLNVVEFYDKFEQLYLAPKKLNPSEEDDDTLRPKLVNLLQNYNEDSQDAQINKAEDNLEDLEALLEALNDPSLERIIANGSSNEFDSLLRFTSSQQE